VITIIHSNIEHLKRIGGHVLKHIPESDASKRAFWFDLANSLPFLQLLLLHSCLYFPAKSITVARYAPLLQASFEKGFSDSAQSWADAMGRFEIQFLLVLVSAASQPTSASATISSIIRECQRDSPLVASVHRSIMEAADIGECSNFFMSKALVFYANIENALKILPGTAFVLRALYERAKRETADTIVARYFLEGNHEVALVLEDFLSQLNGASAAQLPPLLSVLSDIPRHRLHRSVSLLVTAMCKKLLMGHSSYFPAAVDAAAYLLCASTRGSFLSSRRALKLIHSCVLPVWACAGLHRIEMSQAAVSSVCPAYAAVLSVRFNDHPVTCLVNVGWAVVALRDSCVRISVAAACILCAVIKNHGSSCSALSLHSGIPESIVDICLKSLCELGLVESTNAHGRQLFVYAPACSMPPGPGAFAPPLESRHEPELALQCNFTDTDYIAIIQAILAILPHSAFMKESALCAQCVTVTQAPPGKVSHVLAFLESKNLIIRDGEYIAVMSPQLEALAPQHAAESDAALSFPLPNCILQLVIVVPTFQLTFSCESSLSNAVCVSRGKFEASLGQSYSRILPLTGIDQLQLSDRFIENDACVATILFSLHGGAAAPHAHSSNCFSVIRGVCPVCLEGDRDLACPTCSHGACTECWEGYISTALQDDNTQTVNQGSEDRLHLTKLKCIAEQHCTTPLSIDFLARVSPAVVVHMARVLQKSICRSILSVSPAIVQCMYCDVVIVASNELCEAQCTSCGRIKAVGDFKRSSPDQDWISHPNLKSGDLATWQAMNQQVQFNVHNTHTHIADDSLLIFCNRAQSRGLSSCGSRNAPNAGL
jgi:hypothetical protein